MMLNRRRIEEAMALHKEGRLQEAAQKYDALLAMNPGDASLLNLQGILAGQMGDYARSLTLLRKAIDASPTLPQLRNSLAITCERSGDREGAAAAFTDEGNLLMSARSFDKAATAFGHALRVQPGSPYYGCNYAVALIRLGRYDEAATILSALPDEDRLSYIPLNLGNALFSLGRIDEAIAAYDRALKLEPHLVEAHWARGQALLLLGQYQEGWQEYEWRKQWGGFDNPYRSLPEWHGQNADNLGGKVLVVSEQGFGDTIQFARYVALLAAQGYDIVFDVRDELFDLFREGFRHDRVEIVARSSAAIAATKCVAHVPLLTLPHHFSTRPDTIPGDVPYLCVSSARIDAARERVPDRQHLRVGIVRSGQPLHAGNHARSISPDLFEALLSADCDFHSLQITPFDVKGVTELGLGFRNFADTAAAIMAMDLVISVDTAVAHLAGALGKPVWILIPYAPDWRWSLTGDTSPWYPTARLFRQTAPNEWAETMVNLRRELDDFIMKKTPSPASDLNPQALFEQAIALQRDGQFQEAADLYRPLLEAHPQTPAYMVMYAGVLLQLGDTSTAITLIEQAITLEPGQPEYYRAAALAYGAAGDHQKAAATYGELAAVEQREGLFEEAAADFSKATQHDSGNPHLYNDWGVALRCLGRSQEAIAVFSKALEIDPALPSALSNRANLYWEAGDKDAAFRDHRAAVDAQPDDAQIRLNYAVALREVGAREEALNQYNRAIELQPDFAQAHYDRGQLLAHMGQIQQGFSDMEWRWHPTYNYKEKSRGFAQPVWQGELPEDIDGKLLIICEQGFGDTIQFSRYAPLLVACGYRVVLEVQAPLLRLYRESFPRPGLRIVERRMPVSIARFGGLFGAKRIPNFAAYVGMLSLPERFQTILETIPAATPYLSVRHSHVAKWATRLKAPPHKLKVGLVWQGDPKHVQDKTRSMPPAMLEPLIENRAVQFYALQKGPDADWRFPSGAVVNLGNQLADFCDTAAVIKNLDLVISVDTAVAHLAGALNCPVWIMLTQVGEWRWLTDTDRSPWYPSARLFRQEVQGDWGAVIQRVAAELAALRKGL